MVSHEGTIQNVLLEPKTGLDRATHRMIADKSPGSICCEIAGFPKR